MHLGDDYSLPQTVRFGSNETVQNIILEANDDDVVEYDEVLTLNIKITNDLMEIGILPGTFNKMNATIIETDSKSIFLSLAYYFGCVFLVVTVSFESNYTSVMEGDITELAVTASYAFVVTYDILIVSSYNG